MKSNKKRVQISISLASMILIIGSTIIFISCNGCKSTSLTKEKSSLVEKSNLNNDNSSVNLADNSYSEFDLGILKDAPKLPLEEADITEVYGHYILQDTANYQKYHFYDGNKQQTIDFRETEGGLVQLSRNQKYLTNMDLIQNKMSNQYFLNVELRDVRNRTLAKQSIPSAYQDYYDELSDEIIPLEDGSGFIQIGRRLGISCWVAGYKIEGSKFIKKFQIDKPNCFLHDIKANEDGSKIVLKFNTKTNTYEKDTLVLYSMEKGLIWQKELPLLNLNLFHQWDYNKTFLNKQDIYLFNWSNEKGKILRYNFEGQVLDSLEVEQIQHWDFIDSDDGEVLLVYSKKYLYIYNPGSKENKKIDLYTMLQLKGDFNISIRNAIFSNPQGKEEEKLVFTFFIELFPDPKIYFSGVAFYDLTKNDIDAFQSKPLYGRLSSKSNDIFIMNELSNYFSEKITKIDLNKIK